MAGKILLVSRTDHTAGPLAFVILRELVGRSGLEGRARIDGAGIPGHVGDRVPTPLARQVRDLLGLHPSLTLRKYRPKEVTERLLRRQSLVLTLDPVAHAHTTEVAEGIHPVMRPEVKRIQDYPLWEVPDPPGEDEPWAPYLERLRSALQDSFRLIVTDAGL